MQKKYIVRLTAEERTELEAMVKKGKAAADKIKHANILLAADVEGPAWPDRQIAQAFSCHLRSVENVRRRLVLEGLATALERKKQAQPSHPPRLDGKGEARLIALACVFLVTEALAGGRQVNVRPQRTAMDWAQEVATLLEGRYAQAECGVASGMTAAALISLAGAGVRAAVTAASMAFQNSLGMICDPVANRVEVPCLGKNVMAAANALACANMALAGYDPVIPLDEVIETMDRVGRSLPRELRCTALGGLSVTPTSKEIEARLQRPPR